MTTEITKEIQDLINMALDKYDLSTRGLIRVLRVARTIADLNFETNIYERHFMEALNYRLNQT
jgi:magnesium chelatase family protein